MLARSRSLLVAASVLLVAGVVPVPAVAAEAPPSPESTKLRVTTSTGASLAAEVKGAAPLAARPTVVEFTPYGQSGASFSVGEEYNVLTVQIRGTGDSGGGFDVLGPKTQRDVRDTLAWACSQPWSDGRLAVVGFSASAITYFNSQHQELPCVKAAVMRSGTFELYRDLLVPGGVPNSVPGLAVLSAIGGLALAQADQRLSRDPLSGTEVVLGLLGSGLSAGLLNPTLNTYWKERGFRGDANEIPTLLIDGVFDVEPRGDYQAFQQLQAQGTPAQLLVVGAHDGAPRGTDHGVAQIDKWLDRWVLGVQNGVEDEPAVQMLVADGGREQFLDGQFLRYEGSSWPLPGTSWTPLSLSAKRAGTSASPKDGSLTLEPDATTSRQSYAAFTSLPTQVDPHTISTLGAPLNQLTTWIPFLTDMKLANLTGLTFTSTPLKEPVTAIGPGTLDVRLSTTGVSTPIWAVVSDVWPDGSTHPMTVGRLNSAFPGVVREKSLYSDGNLVQPYGDYSTPRLALPGVARDYHVELWPIANRFKAGHRIQVSLVGQSALSLPSVPALNTVTIGKGTGSRLMLPTVPESDLAAALQ
ncbi:CocE/NonD family hydrolase [Aeromicrobium sp. 50.2.37]|uniref:CocE/NonD family hydrolase n=1 Tax=Aeromicrobium sp. 50.2.37 TaxID=2969305 RepID=UPI0021505553|nr:CocE/NonD family hydrolase [Aeromicrobium sp. 50.2.37]MCR4512612.1 CocE/NonD family hydrolase [Aeromicrobium sp. 50.2.37]